MGIDSNGFYFMLCFVSDSWHLNGPRTKVQLQHTKWPSGPTRPVDVQVRLLTPEPPSVPTLLKRVRYVLSATAA